MVLKQAVVGKKVPLQEHPTPLCILRKCLQGPCCTKEATTASAKHPMCSVFAENALIKKRWVWVLSSSWAEG